MPNYWHIFLTKNNQHLSKEINLPLFSGSYAISSLKAYFYLFYFYLFSKDVWIHSPALAHVTACRFLGTKPLQGGKLFM